MSFLTTWLVQLIAGFLISRNKAHGGALTDAQITGAVQVFSALVIGEVTALTTKTITPRDPAHAAEKAKFITQLQNDSRALTVPIVVTSVP